MTTSFVLRWVCVAASLAALSFELLAQPIAPRLYAVEVSATVQTSPPRVTLHWPADANATGYRVSRLNSAGAWVQVGSLAGSATQYIDNNVSIGSAIEYQVLKSTSRFYTGSGYIVTGVNAPAIEQRGKVILLVDATWSTALAPELARLEQDLVGDGWIVLRQNVSRSSSVSQVKSIIQSLYYTDPENVRALFLFGHIPVPYSGDFAADSHANHRGAWPADVFYGDIDGVWTDSTVTSINAEKAWNHNVPGDGKFDQSALPSDLELEVGRVDLHHMTCFANKAWSRNEEYLLRQYLEKDHKFRHGQLPLPRRGLIIDNFGADKEALASVGWRNFSTMFGAENNAQIPWGTYFSTLQNEGYLWSYGNGGGSYYTCAGIGSSDDFALNDPKVVFTFFFGSYYGDWDNESNFLRAPLGTTTYTLTSAWGNRPNWFVHHMALGETIGFSTKLTQNNSGEYQSANIGERKVHSALHGDPTLRMHPVVPPSNLNAALQSGVTLTWLPSTDKDIVGYHVFRGTSEAGPFTRITASPVSGSSFDDPAGTISSVYMVRALKLESSGSGTYYNLSQGIFARLGDVPAAPSSLSGIAQTGGVALAWSDNSNDEQGFRIYRRPASGSYTLITTTAANAESFLDGSAPSGTTNIYAVAAFNDVGESAWSNPATVVPATSASVTFVGADTSTGGSWKGTYGNQGYNIIQNAQSYPSYVNFAASGNNGWVWNSSTADPAALFRAADNTRLAACWYSASSFEMYFWFNDSSPHRVSFYFLDWDRLGRRQVLELFHADTGALLATRAIENFEEGLYLTYDMRGRITARLRPLSGNAVLSGFFFDAALPTVSTPVFNPNGGTFTNSVTVSLSSATSGATIRYTTNGSEPTASSPAYSAPLSIGTTTTIKARAFKSGMAESAVASATFTIVTPEEPPDASVTFLGANSSRGGTWKGVVGAQGHVVIGDSLDLPFYLSLSNSGKSDWLWAYSTADSRALQRESLDSRLAACWYSSDAFEVMLNFNDTQSHRVALYCLDWDRANRQQRVEVLDRATRSVLHSYNLSGFGSGVYLEYNMRGPVIVRFTRVSSFNAVLSGIFFDAP